MKSIKKKVGIITLYGNTNYGNRLQNYAVQEVIKEYGYYPETVVINNISPRGIAKTIYRKIKGMQMKTYGKRCRSLNRFNKRYITKRYVFSWNGIIPQHLSKNYRYFVVGSDQVWNPLIRKDERKNFYLQFAKESQRVCIAPSIGIEKIPKEYREELSFYLKGFRKLSCREFDGAKEISDLSKKECVHIIDPTLSIDAEKWRSFANPVESINQEYILAFFLGDFDKKEKEKILECAKIENYQVIEISDKHSVYNAIDPKEFIWMIDNAKLVITDSFHGVAFSVILNKPFYVYDRHKNDDLINTKSSSRIRSLVSKFELEERYIGDHLDEIDFECRFDKANRILEREKIIFKQYVESCLK